MRSTHFIVFVLAFGLANAQFSGMISGFMEGLVEGGIKGVVGAYAPLVKEGITMMYNLLQTEIRVGLGLIENIMKAVPVLMNTIQNTMSGIFQTGTNLVKSLTGSARISMHTITSTAQHGITGGLATFGGMKLTDQKSIAGVMGNVNRVFVSVTKLQLNSLKGAEKEVPAIRKILESEHKNPQQLFAALKSKAPKLSEYVSKAHKTTSTEFHASTNKLQPSAKKGLNMIQDSFRLSQKGIESTLGSMNANVKKQFGPLFHLMKNMIHVANAAF